MNVVLAIVEWRSGCFKESSFEKTGRWDTKHCSEVLNLSFIFYICKLLQHLQYLSYWRFLQSIPRDLKHSEDKAASTVLDDKRSYWNVNTCRNRFIMSFKMAVMTSHEKYNATCCKFLLPWLLGWDVKLSFIYQFSYGVVLNLQSHLQGISVVNVKCYGWAISAVICLTSWPCISIITSVHWNAMGWSTCWESWIFTSLSV